MKQNVENILLQMLANEIIENRDRYPDVYADFMAATVQCAQRLVVPDEGVESDG